MQDQLNNTYSLVNEAAKVAQMECIVYSLNKLQKVKKQGWLEPRYESFCSLLMEVSVAIVIVVLVVPGSS